MNNKWDKVKPQLSPPILKGLAEGGFEHMTPVQAAVIPQMLSRKDVAVEAVTGSGKTLAFLVPLLEIIKRDHTAGQVRCIIISPTRELASQTFAVLNIFLRHIPTLSAQLIMGGNSLAHSQTHFSKSRPAILVCCPGRMEELLTHTDNEFRLALKTLDILIFDEADRLFELGFDQSIQAILSHCPKQRRTGLFSATLTESVEALVRAGLRNPVRIAVKERGQLRTPLTLSNFYATVKPEAKFNELIRFLRARLDEKLVVFFSTCAAVNHFARLASEFATDVQIRALHGKFRKGRDRQKLLKNFMSAKHGVLFTTDLMARGIDFPDVHWVIQYDPPSSAPCFVHRCGRTARQGNFGNALLLIHPNETDYVKFLEVNQSVTLMEKTLSDSSATLEDFVPAMREYCSLTEKNNIRAKKAFVSFVQAYLKHECQLIFQFREVDVAGLALGFGLAQLPKMPELRGRKFPGFQALAIQYEPAERTLIKKKRRMKQTESFSKAKAGREVKREKNKKKRKVVEMDEDEVKELDSLHDDYVSLKRAKRRQISDEQFMKEVGGTKGE